MFISVDLKSNSVIGDLKPLMITDPVTRNLKFNGPTIIYCITKAATQELSDVLKAFGIRSDVYHAGIGIPQRKINQTKFMNNEIDVNLMIPLKINPSFSFTIFLKVIVATIAFGMGIDKPGIYFNLFVNFIS